jgi:hypothetical protein
MTQWKYQYRAFGDQDPTEVRTALASSGMSKRDQQVTDTYVVGTSNVAARVRDSQIKIKGPAKSVDAIVDEAQDDRHGFPIKANVINDAIGAKRGFLDKSLKSVEDVVDYAAGKKDVVVAEVEKRSAKYENGAFEVEVTEATIAGRKVHTVCVASNDVPKVHDALNRFKVLAWSGSAKMEYAEAIRKYNG